MTTIKEAQDRAREEIANMPTQICRACVAYAETLEECRALLKE